MSKRNKLQIDDGKPCKRFGLKRFLFRILYSENVPNFTCYAICILLFVHFVKILILRYLEYKTNVLIQYDIPRQVKFPAFTICACSSTSAVCPTKFQQVIHNEIQLYRSASALDILTNISIKENHIVSKCFYVFDSRQPQYQHSCGNVEPVVETLHDGRKCFSYLTILSDKLRKVPHLRKKTRDTILAEQYGNVSYIRMEVNFTEAAIKLHNLEQNYDHSTGSSIILSMHAAEAIPTTQDIQFYILQPGQFYQFHFGKRVTELMPHPYVTNCRRYHETKRPRTQNECFHMCIMAESYRKFNCLSYSTVITKGWIKSLIESGDIKTGIDNVKICDRIGKIFFIEYIAIRRSCIKKCIQPDCHSEFYYTTYESSSLKSALSTNDSNFKYSIVTIFPDMNRYEKVKHTEDLSVFEVIGAIGGHAHIWLGLSAIQIYDILWNTGRRLRFFWDKWSSLVMRT